MKKFLWAAAAAFLLFGYDRALADDVCHSAKDLVDALSSQSPNLSIETVQEVRGSDAQKIIDAYNAQPPQSNIDADSVIFLREVAASANKPVGVYFISLMKAGCVAAVDHIPENLIRSMLEPGA